MSLAETLASAVREQENGNHLGAAEAYRAIIPVYPDHPELWFLLGTAHQSLADFKEAIACYRQALQLKPDYAEVCNNLGLALEQIGEREQAFEAYRTAVDIKPDYVDALNNLGAFYHSCGANQDANDCLRRAVNLQPTCFKARNNLGLSLNADGKHEEALECFQAVIRSVPFFPDAHNNLGVLLMDQGKYADAEVSFRAAIDINPRYSEAHNNLGIVYRRLGRLDDALHHLLLAIGQNSQYAEAHNNLGEVLDSLGRQGEALIVYREAIRLKPEYPEALNNYGNALWKAGLADQALAAFDAAVGLKPDLPEAHNNIGIIRLVQGRFEEAQASFRQAIRFRADYAEAFANLGNAFRDHDKLDEAITTYEKAIQIDPRNAAIHSNLVYALHFDPHVSPDAIFTEHQRWGRMHADEFEIAPHCVDRSERRLRIGYVSGDFREHVMGSFSEAIIEAHDRSRFEVFCYSNVVRSDRRTERIRGLADHWRSLIGVSDGDAAELVTKDRIDILVDLSGHTADNRLLVFARKPAPIQVTHFGYCDTSGMRAMDYRLTDALSDPPGMTERYHAEQLVRLPILWCYPPPPVDEDSDTPAKANRFITFGSLNSPSKHNAEVVALWSRVLKEVPNSRLLLLSGDAEQWLRAGIDNRRICFTGKKERQAYLRLYQEIDVCLDPFPFNGCNTTADALWMGTPVITLAGRTCVSRQGVSLLTHIGLPELIADSRDDLVRIAVQLSADVDRLSGMRATIRHRMKQALLTKPVEFTRHLELAYLGMWKNLVNSPTINM